MNQHLTIALPKGRLTDKVLDHLKASGIELEVGNRELVARDKAGELELLLVKNSDLPVYVNHGIAGLGVCGEDVLYESGIDFYRLLELPYGKTRMCLAGRKGIDQKMILPPWKIATKFSRFARNYYHNRGIPVEIIKLNGSVELAPVLGLTPFIVDLVETGSTLKANNLEVLGELKKIGVYLIANPAYYKCNYTRINELIELLKGSLKA
ncbi:MAG: ATP phosphoribosyltransferase [Spirochaetia bacterium]